MIVFEIYFYFNYIILIEKDVFYEQIDNYISELKSSPIDSNKRMIIKYELKKNKKSYQKYLNYLYNQYIDSLKKQQKILHTLLTKSCTIAGIVSIILFILFNLGLYNRKKIKWIWIIIENLFMFLFLGIFEYYFFVNIVMNYNPVTNEEVKYHIANDIITYFNSTTI